MEELFKTVIDSFTFIPPAAPTGLPLPGANIDPAESLARARRILEGLEMPIPAPEGWSIAPCEGMAPMLCIETANSSTAVELALFPMSTHTDFQAHIAAHGLDVATLETDSELYREVAEAVLHDFIAEHLDTIKMDRQITFGDEVIFTPLETQAIDFGGLPGVKYGFVLTGQDGQLREHVIAYATFDRNYLYIINSVYDPAYIPSMPSIEDLLLFEPYLQQIVAALPVAE
jgi:hypothetical protein